MEIAQLRIEPIQNLHDRSMILEHQKLQEHQIEHGYTEEDAPHSRMGSSEGSVWKGEHRYDQEEERDAEHSGPDVGF